MNTQPLQKTGAREVIRYAGYCFFSQFEPLSVWGDWR